MDCLASTAPARVVTFLKKDYVSNSVCNQYEASEHLTHSGGEPILQISTCTQ